ncbi:MAG: NAD(P)/FAD-dependent oxidoreductase [Alphaproteobacteria bacterium]
MVIIGAGPAGLFAVFELGMLKLSCHVIDALPEVGGQCTALYPEKPIYDIPGFPRIDAGQLVEALEAQARPFQPTYHLAETVAALDDHRDGDGRLTVTTDRGTRITARAVVIAAGGGAFGPNRPPLPGIQDYEKTSVFYAIRRREDFRGKRVVIAGGGDSAVDWALALADVAAHVMVVHRRPRFRAAPESAAQLQALAETGRIELVIPYQLAGLTGAGGRLRGVSVRTLEGHERLLEADVLLPFFGLSSDLGAIAGWGLATERNLIRTDPASGATSRAGVYAIGDVAQYPGKLKLILCGFSEAAMTAHAIWSLIHPDQALHFEYSTTQGLPGGE